MFFFLHRIKIVQAVSTFNVLCLRQLWHALWLEAALRFVSWNMADGPAKACMLDPTRF